MHMYLHNAFQSALIQHSDPSQNSQGITLNLTKILIPRRTAYPYVNSPIIFDRHYASFIIHLNTIVLVSSVASDEHINFKRNFHF